MPTQILSNRRVSTNNSWNATWSALNSSIPALDSKTMVDLDCAYAYQDFHLCLLSNNGKIFLASRNPSQVWSSNLLDIETIPAIGSIGPFKDLSCAGNNDRGLFICAVTQDGRIVVIYRYWPNTWQVKTLNLELVTSEVGIFNRVSCAYTSNGTLHICGLASDGKIYHTLLNPDFSWQTFMGNVNTKMNSTLSFIDLACAVNAQGDLHVCAITQNKVYHTIRFHTLTWQQGFGDVEAQTSDVNGYHRIGCGCEQNGDLHLCFRTTASQIYHTFRYSTGWQTFIANIAQASASIAPVSSICCDGSGNKVDFIAVK